MNFSLPSRRLSVRRELWLLGRLRWQLARNSLMSHVRQHHWHGRDGNRPEHDSFGQHRQHWCGRGRNHGFLDRLRSNRRGWHERQRRHDRIERQHGRRLRNVRL